jgi:hypothetical protein
MELKMGKLIEVYIDKSSKKSQCFKKVNLKEINDMTVKSEIINKLAKYNISVTAYQNAFESKSTYYETADEQKPKASKRKSTETLTTEPPQKSTKLDENNNEIIDSE